MLVKNQQQRYTAAVQEQHGDRAGMRILPLQELQEALFRLIETASFKLGSREVAALHEASAAAEAGVPAQILQDLVTNTEVAQADRRPLCQDTGVAVLFLDIGQEVTISGGPLHEGLQKTVAQAYTKLHLRKSIVRHPLDRQNTGDNTPAIIYTRIVPGQQVRLCFAAKGGGCENMSAIAMLPPAAGREGVVDFICRTVVEAGGNPCPPVIVGIGLGGTFDRAALLAKEALLRPLGDPAPHPLDAELEVHLQERLNEEGGGPMGLGGAPTVLAVHVESHPCHIASLPVAVNLDCHSHRHAEAVL